MSVLFIYRSEKIDDCEIRDVINITIIKIQQLTYMLTRNFFFFQCRIDGQRMLPIRWLPPEALSMGKFTIESDIWSYGVLLWELFTYGMTQYYPHTNEQVSTLSE